MPVTYQIDQTEKIIRTVCSNPLTLVDVMDHFRELRENPACPEHLDVLLNVTAVDDLPDSRELSAVSRELGAVRQKIRLEICAIVAGRDAMFGMMRVFEAFAHRYFLAIRVFRDADEAEIWLIAQRKKRDAENTPQIPKI